jgi:hypothetical protein
MLAEALSLSHRISGALTSFEVTGWARARTRPRRSARVLARQRNERDVYKVSLQTSGQRPLLCSRKGLWPW